MLRNWTELSTSAKRFTAASAVSFFGDGMRYAALPLLAARHGAGPVGLGVLLGFATLPFLVLGVFGGVLADRMRRRGLLVACDALRFVIMGGFLILVALGQISLPLLFAVAFLMGLLESVATSATFAYLPHLVEEKHLERANAMSSTALLLGRQFLGPLAGALLLEYGEALPFVLDGTTFLCPLLLLLMLPKGLEPEPERPAGEGPRAVFADVRVSARWIRVTPHVLVIACSAGLINLFNMGALAVQPVYAEDVLGGSSLTYALMMAAAALGGVLGAQGSGALSSRLGSGAMVCVSLVMVAAGYLVVAVSPHQLLAYAGLALTGAGFSVRGVATVSWRQRLTPDHLRGRADALHRMISWGVNPAGSVLGGVLAAHWGARLPFLLVGFVPMVLLPFFLGRRSEPVPDAPAEANDGVPAGGVS